MSEETLLTASRRLVRFFRIDMEKGGLVVDETLVALETVERQVALDRSADLGLVTSATLFARDLRLDMGPHGGMIQVATEIACSELDKVVTALSRSEPK